MDGARCPLYPTCSAWSEQAIRQHGFYGLLLFLDRLFYREFGALHNHYVAVPIPLSQRLRYYDPLTDTFGYPEESNQDPAVPKRNGPSLLRDDF